MLPRKNRRAAFATATVSQTNTWLTEDMDLVGDEFEPVTLHKEVAERDEDTGFFKINTGNAVSCIS